MRTIRDYVSVLRRHLGMLVVLVVLALVAAAAVTFFQTETYRSEASVVIRTTRNQQLFPLGSAAGLRLTRELGAEVDFTSTDRFTGQVRADTPPGTDVAVVVDDDSDLLRFVATGDDANAVQVAANLWAGSYLTVRDAVDLESNRASVTSLESSIEELRAERDLVLEPVQPIDELIAEASDPETLAQLTTQRIAAVQLLDDELAPLNDQLRQLNQQLSTIEVDAQLRATPGTSAVLGQQAAVPSQPISPSWPRNLLLGGLAGLGVAIGAVLLVDSLRTRLLDADELERIVGAQSLGTVPRADSADLFPAAVLAGTQPAVAEAVQRIVSGLLFLHRVEGRNVFMVTSPARGEGKTTVVAMVGALLGRAGTRVVIAGGDLRRPSIHDRFGLPGGPGLAEFIAGEIALADAVHRIDGIPNVAILAAGDPRSSPADLIRSQEFTWAVKQLRDAADFVLIDAPPALPVADAVEIARVVDGVVMIGRAGSSQREDLEHASALIRSGGGEIVGTVLNASRTAADNYDTYEADL